MGKKVALFFFVLLVIFPFTVTSATLLRDGYIYLNTSVQSSGSFEIYGIGVNNSVEIPFKGSSSGIYYTLTSTSTDTLKIKITSLYGSGSTMRLKRSGAENYLTYTLKFDYDGQGSLQPTPVTNGATANIVKFQNSYDLLVGDIIIDTSGSSGIAGTYTDTITFEIIGL